MWCLRIGIFYFPKAGLKKELKKCDFNESLYENYKNTENLKGDEIFIVLKNQDM